METHSSILAWRIPWTEEIGRLHFTGSQRHRHNESDLEHVHAHFLSLMVGDMKSAREMACYSKEHKQIVLRPEEEKN